MSAEKANWNDVKERLLRDRAELEGVSVEELLQRQSAENEDEALRKREFAAERLLKRLEAVIPPRYRDANLDILANETQRNAAPDAISFVDDVLRNGIHGQGILITGSVGIGKTHLAYAVLRNLLTANVACAATTCSILFYAIREAFSTNATAPIIEPLRSAPVLLLDDFGSEAPKEWILDTMLAIVQHRYENCLVNVVTTNLNLSEMEKRAVGQDQMARLYDRILEMTPSVIVLTGKSLRHDRS